VNVQNYGKQVPPKSTKTHFEINKDIVPETYLTTSGMQQGFWELDS
jgi:hypothetical protein